MFGSLQIGAAGSMHPDCQEIALRIDQQGSFAPPDFFPRVVALFGTTNGTGFDRLAVDDGGTGLRISTLLVPHLSA